jgi:dihydroorotate dehydrogenase (fumarate)
MDLSTNYLGLKLKNPLVPSSSPLSRNLYSMRRMEDSGAAAIVLFSLFEEQITLESQTLNHYLTQGV